MKSAYFFLLILFFSTQSFAQSDFTRADFVTTGSAIAVGDRCFQLTPAVVWHGGTMWYKDAINLNAAFEMELDMIFGCHDPGADGMVFIFHPILKDGFQGEGIGFGGLYPAFGIEMDTYENPHLADPQFDHVALIKNGRMHHHTAITRAVSLLPGNKNIEDCKAHRVRISWNPDQKIIEIQVDGSMRLKHKIDIVDEIFGGNPIVYWGISSATGGEHNEHKVCLEKLEFDNPDALNIATKKALLNGEDVSLKNVDFASGKTSLDVKSKKELDKLVDFLKHNPDRHIVVSGHTDNIGSKVSNQRISQKRAEAVASYLESRGIDKERIRAYGYGEEYPLNDNSTPEKRKENRRIEVALIIPRA